MDNIQHHIDRLESKIDFYRYRAKKLRKWGRILRWPIPFLLLAIGGLAAFTVLLHGATGDRLFGGPKTTRFENYLYDSHPFIWGTLYVLGPPMVSSDPHEAHLGFAVWLAGWGFLVGGFMWFGDRALKKAVELEKDAQKYDDILMANKPTWIGLDTLIKMQGLQAGSGNTISIVNQINKMINPAGREQELVCPADWSCVSRGS